MSYTLFQPPIVGGSLYADLNIAAFIATFFIARALASGSFDDDLGIARKAICLGSAEREKTGVVPLLREMFGMSGIG